MNDAPADLFTAAGVEMPAAKPKLTKTAKEKTIQINLWLTAGEIERISAAGNGNLTAGIKALLDPPKAEPVVPSDSAIDRMIDAMKARDHLPPGEQFAALMADPLVEEAEREVKSGKSHPAPPNVGFDGETIDPLRDEKRLTKQMADVWSALMCYLGQWVSISIIQKYAEQVKDHYHTDQGISARLRDLRKIKYGCWDVERKPSGTRGLWLYRLNPKQYEERLAQYRASLEREHPTGAGTALPLPGFENLGD